MFTMKCGKKLIFMTFIMTAAMIPSTFAAPKYSAMLNVSNFEEGFLGWDINVTPPAGAPASKSPLVSLSLANEAHTGQHSLQVTFHPGQGRAAARFKAIPMANLWASAQIDELVFWIKGDGSDKEIQFVLNAFPGNWSEPTPFTFPLSLKETNWHEVVIPLTRLQASVPDKALCLKGLFTLELARTDGAAQAQVWIDDLVARGAHGEGKQFAVSPLDNVMAGVKPPASRPRLSLWGAPIRWGATPGEARAYGLDFYSSSLDCPLVGQKEYLEGIITYAVPERPATDGLLSGLGLTAQDYDQDAQGKGLNEGIQSSIFHPAVVERYCQYMAAAVRGLTDDPWIESFAFLSPISMYGEAHYSPSIGGKYAVYSRPALKNFQGWMKRQYRDDLASIARAWGEPLKDWNEVVPPDGPKAVSDGIDTRRSWSDFMHWYNAWYEEVHERMLVVARRETPRPLGLLLGGPQVGAWQGISLGNIGPVTKILSRHKPNLFHPTDGETLFSVKYARTACAQYRIQAMTTENVGDPDIQIYHQFNIMFNVLAGAVDRFNICGGDRLFLTNKKDEPFGQTWRAVGPVLQRYRTTYRKSDAAFFHSYLTSWFRPNRSNMDTLDLYDKTNRFLYDLNDMTRKKDKNYPSWGRALGGPDVVDDVMIEDGGLAGRKLLVIPNSSVTVTSRKAVEAIRAWVKAGGTLIGFGPGCLAWTLEPDRTLKSTPSMDGMVSDEASAKTRTGEAGLTKTETKLGQGRVIIYATPADPVHQKDFTEKMLPVLAEEARQAGVRSDCHAESNGALTEDINLLYCGPDLRSGCHLFVVDLMQQGMPELKFWSGRTFDLVFDPALKGEAELVGATDNFKSCEGGEAEYDQKTRILTVRFKLPTRLTLTMK